MSSKKQTKIGERRSARRDAILEVLRDASGAMTPDEIHQLAEQQVSGLGIATVYRNLKLMCEAGLVQQVILPDGVARYETAAKKHHHHFHCTRCDRTFCLDGCMLSGRDARLPPGFQVDDHEITLYGSCPECSK